MAVFRSVFYELKGKKTNIVLVTLILLVMCILLCTAFLFGRSSKIESALLQQVPIEYEFYNNHYYINTDDHFSGEEYEYDIDYKDHLTAFLHGLEKLCAENEVVDYNYNTIIKMGGSGRVANYSGQYPVAVVDCLGVNKSSFQENESLNIISGRFFTDEELVNGERKAVISSLLLDQIKEDRSVSVGDSLELYLFELYPETDANGNIIIYTENGTAKLALNTGESQEYEIIGVYESEYRYDYSGGLDSIFNHNSYVLLPEKAIEDSVSRMNFDHFGDKENILINKCSDSAEINKIWLRLDDYSDIESFEKAYRYFMTEFDDLDLELKPQNFRNTLESVKVIKNVYNIILYISITISSVMLVNIIIYVERKQKNDTMISYSLGNSRMAIISSKFLTYLVISLPSLLTGGIISFFISNSLMNKIIHNNAMIQEKYLKYANNGVTYKKIADITIDNIKLSDLTQSMMICSVIIVTMMLLTVVPVIMISLSNDEIRRVND